MKRLVFSISILLGFFVPTISQISDKPILLGNRSHYDEDTDALFHSLENVRYMFEKDRKASFAVRVCSPDPLPVAFADAAGVSYGIRIVKQQLDYLKEYSFLKIPERNIYLLRNEKRCKFYKNTTLTEYWFVPSNANLPEFVEAGDPKNFLTDNLILNFKEFDGKLTSSKKSGDLISLTPVNYKIIKLNIFELLRKDKISYILINYPTYGTSRRIIYSKALQLQAYLVKKGIGKHRVYIKRCVTACYIPENEKNALYPNVTIVYQKL